MSALSPQDLLLRQQERVDRERSALKINLPRGVASTDASESVAMGVVSAGVSRRALTHVSNLGVVRPVLQDPRSGISVRRPLMGIEPKTPSYAVLEVVSLVQGTRISLVNSSHTTGWAPGTANFLLQSLRWSPSESVQVIKTFASWYLADLGEDPETVLISGVLLESANFPWLREWEVNWRHYLRARRCILNEAEVHLTVEGTTYKGYLVNCEVGRTHDLRSSWSIAPFSAQLLIRSVTQYNPEGVQIPQGPQDPGFDIHPVLQHYRQNFEQEAEAFGVSPLTMARATMGAEMVVDTEMSGLFVPEDLEEELDFTPPPSQVVYDVQVARLTALAAHINAVSGQQIFDLYETRRGLVSMQNAVLEARGHAAPYGTASTQDAFQQRVTRQVASGADAVIQGTAKKARAFFW